MFKIIQSKVYYIEICSSTISCSKKVSERFIFKNYPKEVKGKQKVRKTVINGTIGIIRHY
jgi:hypothetical protein